MSGRRVVWAAGVGVVVAAANSAVINKLQSGWQWWAAAGVFTLFGAVVAGWLAANASGTHRPVGPGAVVAGRDISGQVRTDGSVAAGSGSPMRETGVGPGAVVAGRDIAEKANIDTTGSSRQGSGR